MQHVQNAPTTQKEGRNTLYPLLKYYILKRKENRIKIEINILNDSYMARQNSNVLNYCMATRLHRPVNTTIYYKTCTVRSGSTAIVKTFTRRLTTSF